MKREILNSISIGVQGKVLGFQYKGEELGDAAARCVFEAEQNGNVGHSRIHLELKPEHEPLQGHSQFATTLAAALTSAEFSDGHGLVGINPGLNLQITAIIDKELEQIRDAFKDLQPCPIVTHHPEGPCAFCAGYAMRQVLLIEEAENGG